LVYSNTNYLFHYSNASLEAGINLRGLGPVLWWRSIPRILTPI
jgi:hypothetical protein